MEIYDNSLEPVLVSERLSRRRKARGTSIILSSAKASKLETSSTSVDNESAEMKVDSSVVTSTPYRRRQSKVPIYKFKFEHYSASLIQQWWRRKHMMTKISKHHANSHAMSTAKRQNAANIISKWYSNSVDRKHFVKYTLNFQWTKKMSDKVFAIFILGRRVRRLMTSERAIASIMVIKDLRIVISQILYPESSNINATTLSSATFDESVLHRLGGFSNLSTADLILVKGLVKQYFQSKEDLYQFVFKGVAWVAKPAPGYWDLSAAVYRRLHETNLHRSPIPSKQTKQTQAKKPRRGSVSAFAFLNSSLEPNVSDDNTIDLITLPKGLLKSSQSSSHHRRSQQPGASTTIKSLASSVSSSRRSGSKAHIQLDILSAQKLMPAKKVSRDR
jgi:hypothetical protein